MINAKHAREYCREPIENIKNYAEAVASAERWECHHINGRWWTKKQLLKIGMYYKRPASELVFLSASEHRLYDIHGSKKEQYRKIGEAQRGKVMSAESRQKMSASHQGRKLSDSTRRNMSKSAKGKNTWSKGRKRVYHEDGTYTVEKVQC